MKNWYENMDKITIFIGFAIIYLGICNLIGVTVIPPALVTGISISGFCLTLSDSIDRLKENRNKKFLSFFANLLGNLLYFLAATSIVCFPYMLSITSLSEDTLEKMSTIASVIALGFVFVSIGYNNKREALKAAEKRNEKLDKLLADVRMYATTSNEMGEQMDKLDELMDKTVTIIKRKDEQINELTKLVKELQEQNANTPF
ncbi:hypothetical protein [Bacillus cereus]|uniref:hypothetical protein n=1 Tax=Bacillus TaxID=1386 RepID=UPI001D0E2299|nr:hypothetical protein [Bacillus cereus]MCC2361654.1 hypothetical protein [Bacillus cereus]